MITVVGAGLSGAAIAERFASQLNESVVVVESRKQIGGNCADVTTRDGLLVPYYGPHFFHTRDEEVWNYVRSFAQWRSYEHRVLSYVDGTYVPVPVNIRTVNALLGLALRDAEQMREWLRRNTDHIAEPRNSEEAALRRVGRVLYEKMFRGYTIKQWGVEPSELDPEVMDRIPVRENFDDRYFDDPFQAVPVGGYTALVEQMLLNRKIDVKLNVDYFDIRGDLPKARMVFFTGRVDRFFPWGDPLEYRSLDFDFQTVIGDRVLPATTVNYPNDNTFTRITEPKSATGQQNAKTALVVEYPMSCGEPYYPVLNKRNREVFARYQAEAKRLESSGIHFVGRLANYKYFNMDQAIRNSLDLFERVKEVR